MAERLGRYELIKELGSGGMAVVHLARVVGEGGFERLVAVKRLHDQMARDRDFVSMFLDEARLAAQIRHPNVVPTIDVQRTDEALFLVMEYVEGLPLSGLLRILRRNKRRLPIPIALRILLDVLHGLDAAHELCDREGRPMNLVHRDVTPQNVLVGRDGVSRLTDFGVARAEARLSSTRGGQLKGKLPYMPPEQITDAPFDRRADIYAAGLVLWEMLVGRRAFLASNEGALIHKILDGVSEPPRAHNPNVPEAIERVCMTAVALDRERRYARAGDFAEALERAARAAHVEIAGVRSLSAFMKQHAPADALPPPGEPSSDLLSPPSLRSASVPSVVASTPSQTETAFAAPRARGSRPLLLGSLLLLIGVAGVGVWSYTTGMWRAEPAPTAEVASEEGSDVAATQQPTDAPPPTASVALSASVAPSAGVAPSASVSGAAASSAPAPPPLPRARITPPPPPRGGASTPNPQPKSGSAADFLPPEL